MVMIAYVSDVAHARHMGDVAHVGDKVDKLDVNVFEHVGCPGSDRA